MKKFKYDMLLRFNAVFLISLLILSGYIHSIVISTLLVIIAAIIAFDMAAAIIIMTFPRIQSSENKIVKHYVKKYSTD